MVWDLQKEQYFFKDNLSGVFLLFFVEV